MIQEIIIKKLDKLGIVIKNKPLSLGVRVEYQQFLFDSIQY